MAAILEPRTHHHVAPGLRPRPAPRHLAPVAPRPGQAALAPVLVGRGDGRSRSGAPSAPHAVAVPSLGQVLPPGTVLAMAATVLVAVLLALAVAAGAFSALVPSSPAPAGGSRAPAGAVAPGGAATVVVQPGDSLWSIARQLQPEGDVRPLVHRLAQLNGGGPLHPGTVLLLPS